MAVVNDQADTVALVPPLRDQYLATPHPQRLSPQHPRFAEIMSRHAAAVAAGEPCYADPATGLTRFHRGVPRRAWLLLRKRMPALPLHHRLSYGRGAWHDNRIDALHVSRPKSFQLDDHDPADTLGWRKEAPSPSSSATR